MAAARRESGGNVTVTVITPPATSLVTLAEAKAMLLIDHTADDALITAMIAAATIEAAVYWLKSAMRQAQTQQ